MQCYISLSIKVIKRVFENLLEMQATTLVHFVWVDYQVNKYFKMKLISTSKTEEF